MKVLAAMSGGVDSAVAAARAVDTGHDVTGVHFALSTNPAANREGSRGCCTLSDARDARRAADLLGIPFYVWDLAETFREQVIDDFVAEYRAGRTPNPCVRCNERIKFAAVLDRALALGFDAVCTGHYARLEVSAAGDTLLRRGMDEEKDQSYVLAVLPQERLRHAMFPLGTSRKVEVRAEAERRGLLVARKPDSYDICFIPDGDTAGWLRERIGDAPGDVVDAATGETLGAHAGTHGFTIGQRRGLGLGRPAQDGKPRYVVGIDPATSTVAVGPPTLLQVDRIVTERVTWLSWPWQGRRDGLMAQVRAHGAPVPASAYADAGTLVVDLESPLRAVAAGQTVVLYDGDTAVVSGTINSTRRLGAQVEH